MKKLLALTLTLMLTVLYLASCAKKADEDARRKAMGGYDPGELGFRIIEMDSCEWLAKYETNSTGFFTHRGRCKFCAERNKETLKEILKGE